MHDIYASATLKLTAWYMALVVAISLTFSGVVYYFATNELAQRLANQEARIYRTFPVFYGNPFFARDSDTTEGAHHILLNLAYANIAVYLIAGFAAYWLAKRTLRPIAQSNERQRRFVADASHELRTPVTALKMGSEVALLDKHAPAKELRAALQSNLEEADKLDALLSNLLRLSQLESAELRQQFADVNLADLAAAAIAQVKERAAARHITVHAKPPAGQLTGDRGSLVQLLTIILDNAVKYSPEGTTVRLSGAADEQTVTITVKDQGIGIEPEALRHVFDRFYRADAARTKDGGYGLGLSIAKHIADLHGGSITLTSAVGKGTTATINLPKMQPAAGIQQ